MIYREPYREKYIKDLDGEDSFVSISGIIVSKDDNNVILDDNTGRISVNINIGKVGQFVRVFGRILPFEEGIQIQGEVLQDLSEMDKFLYNKVRELLL